VKSANRLTAAQRDRAIGRLRDLTIGTAVAGVIATVGLASVAAASNPGSSADSGATTAAVTGSTSGSSTTTTATTTPTPATATATPSTTIAPTTTSGNAHVSTGSS
jgi:hypothetical protein